MIEIDADLAIVVGGYNSSNTEHIVELLEEKFPTFFINSPSELIDEKTISHFSIHEKEKKKTQGYLPLDSKPTIILTSGASCPDKLVEEVMLKILSFYPNHNDIESVMADF